METHYEEALISLKRKYGKDDLIRALIAENNKLKTQIDELDEYRYKAEKIVEAKYKERFEKHYRENKKLRDNFTMLLLKLKEYEKGNNI